MAKKLKLQVGDQVTLEDTYYDREFAFLVTEIVDYDATLGIFMKQDVLNSLLGAPEDDFNCLHGLCGRVFRKMACGRR